MKKRVILCGSKWEFDDPAYEIGHNRTTSATQWFKMGDVRNGHVVGKLEDIVPFLLSIHRPGAETSRVVPSRIAVNSSGPSCKFCALPVETSVMIQVMDIEFTSAAANSTNIFIWNVVTLLRDDLI